MKFTEFTITETTARAIKDIQFYGDSAYFVHNSIRYRVDMVHTNVNDKNKYKIEVSFSWFNDRDRKWYNQFSKFIPQQEIYVVFATVMYASYMVAKERKPATVVFKGLSDRNATDATKRLNVYSKYAKDAVAEAGYEFSINNNVLSLVRKDVYKPNKKIKTPPINGIIRKSKGLVVLSISKMNAHAVSEIIGHKIGTIESYQLPDGVLRIDELNLHNPTVTISTGYINEVRSWWKALGVVEWYDSTTKRRIRDSKQRIGGINGKVIILNEKQELEVWDSINDVNMGYHPYELSPWTDAEYNL
jgi:hypothetical protein